jgi:hypothetical protein
VGLLRDLPGPQGVNHGISCHNGIIQALLKSTKYSCTWLVPPVNERRKPDLICGLVTFFGFSGTRRDIQLQTGERVFVQKQRFLSSFSLFV